MKKFFVIAAVVLPFIAMSCASASRYTYSENPTSLKKGITKYSFKNPAVTLTVGSGAIAGDKTFANQDVLTEQFKKSLSRYLSEKNLLAAGESKADAKLEITISFTRKFQIGGKALGAPSYDYAVHVTKNEKTLVRFADGQTQLSRGKYKDFSYNVKIAALQKGAKDELEDVDFISEKISEGVSEIGE